jgi:hypothetical protein
VILTGVVSLWTNALRSSSSFCWATSVAFTLLAALAVLARVDEERFKVLADQLIQNGLGRAPRQVWGASEATKAPPVISWRRASVPT